ncbi:MAG: type II toxin-antitoxin system prevent-host-death family antitoxin [Desulfomonilaceae bacterium]|nr:type II toxin-antitoxin system prevent-host-death family antitoxin [Desulfomonilaceae bacterium]
MTQVDILQAKKRFLELVERAAAGEEVIISKDEKPLVKLGPVVSQKGRRRFGSAKGLITIPREFDDPLEDFKEYT